MRYWDRCCYNGAHIAVKQFMNENPYHAPQTECKLAPSEGVPAWRKVVGGAIFFSIIGQFIVAPVIYLVASLVAAFIDK
jgi:hypothetical protein